MADFFKIDSDLSNVCITPLHFLLYKYLPQEESVLDSLLDKINAIKPDVTNMFSLMRLE